MASDSQLKVNKVFDAFVESHHDVKDDTVLEKFVEWFRLTFDKALCVEFLTSRPESLNSFLQKAAEDRNLQEDSQKLGLALQIAGHIGSHCFKTLETKFHLLTNLFDVSQDEVKCWKEASVRNAFLTGLSYLSHSNDAFGWTVEKGYWSVVLQCLYDPSIFVSKSSQKLLSLALVKLSEPLIPGPCAEVASELSPDYSSTSSQLFQTTVDSLLTIFKKPKVSWTKLKPILEVLGGLPDHGPIGDKLLGKILHDHCLIENLCNHLVTADGTLPDLLCDQFTRLLDGIYMSGLSEAEKGRILELPMKMMENGHVIPAMKMATWLSCKSKASSTSDVCTVLLPVNELLGKPRSPQVDKKVYQVLAEQLKDKYTCIRIVQHSISLLTRLPCESTEGVDMLLCNLLHCTLGTTQTQVKHLVNCMKIQQACLEAFHSTFTCQEEGSRILLDCCIQLIAAPTSSYILVSKSFQCVEKILQASQVVSNVETGELLDILAQSLVRRLCDVRWEIRDSAVGFIGTTVKLSKERSSLQQWIVDNRLVHQVWQSLSDGESYVRATAVQSLGLIASSNDLWTQFTNNPTQDEVVDRVIETVTTDTEAFSRRAALNLLCVWTNANHFPARQNQFKQILCAAIDDFDWEIKLLVLTFWEGQLNRNVQNDSTNEPPSYALVADGRKRKVSHQEGDSMRPGSYKMLENFHQEGCLDTLLVGVTDYDQSVQQKACQILLSLKHLYKHMEDLLSTDSFPNKKITADIPIMDPCTTRNVVNSTKDVKHFWKVLQTLDLDSIIANSSESIDEHTRNPMSLLDDILTSLKVDDEDNFADCY